MIESHISGRATSAGATSGGYAESIEKTFGYNHLIGRDGQALRRIEYIGPCRRS
jgi:hypothetical protein